MILSGEIIITNNITVPKEFENFRALLSDEALISLIYTAYKSRHYHNLTHIQSMINEAIELFRFTPMERNKDAFLMAILFHDLIQGTSNDIENTIKITEKLMKGNPYTSVPYLSNLIRATDHFNLGELDSFEKQFIHDLDLSVLSAGKKRYESYVQDILRESSFNFTDFVASRIQVIQYFLDMDRIYLTDVFSDREEKAINNLQKELEMWKKVKEKHLC